MDKPGSVFIIVLLGLLVGCGSDNPNETQEQAPQGVLTNRQQQALDGAASVEQILLDAAADRDKELEARLRNQ
ncbi:MAG: hypothetical protein IIC10_07635 [Proteobacteria bacterium]|nr:hypothetical protein [Pseudomonadota bacterium]